MKTYFLIALRRLYREKLYAFISVFSLSIAMAAVIIVGSFVQFEMSFDKYHPDHQRIVRVLHHSSGSDGSERVNASTSTNWGQVFTKDFPNIGTYVELGRARGTYIYQDNLKKWEDTYYANENVFDVFHHKTLYGKQEGSLDNPDSIAISENFAQFYFGSGNPIGKQLLREGKLKVVTLVFENLPENTHLRYDALLPQEARPTNRNPLGDVTGPINLNFVGPNHYLKLHPEFDLASFSALSKEFVDRYQTTNRTIHYSLQPLSRIRLLDSHVSGSNGSNLARFFGISAVGLLVILIGCINTINLATARASRVLSLLSMQRLLGADKSALITQSLCESLVMSIAALVFGIGLVEIAGRFQLSDLIGGSKSILLWQSSPLFTSLLLFSCVLVAMISALYPAWHTARLSKNDLSNSHGRSTGSWARNTLVSFQLLLAIGSIAGTLLLLNQIRFLTDKDLGFKLDNRVVISIDGEDRDAVMDRLQNELQILPDVISASRSSWIPSGGLFFNMRFGMGHINQESNPTASVIVSDEHFFNTLGIELIETALPFNDKPHTVYVNEAFVSSVSWYEQNSTSPLGQTINSPPGLPEFIIGGVFKDFHSTSLYRPVAPIIMTSGSVNHPIMKSFKENSQLIVYFDTDDENSFLQTLSETISKHNPGHPVEFDYLQDNWNALYGDDNSVFNQIRFFAATAILLSLLGLFGLAAYSAQAKQREISIRKVIGATTINNLVLMGKNVLLISIVASIPAWFVVYKLYQLWLERFVYQVDLSLSIFVLASFAVVLLSQATVLSQSWRASQRNPAESLRYE